MFGSQRQHQENCGELTSKEEKLFEVVVQCTLYSQTAILRKVTKNSALDFWSDGTPPQRKVMYNEEKLRFRKEHHFSRQTFGWWLNKQRCDCSPILTLSLFFIKSFCSLAQKESTTKKVRKGGFLRRI